jgi:hypothetical protein
LRTQASTLIFLNERHVRRTLLIGLDRARQCDDFAAEWNSGHRVVKLATYNAAELLAKAGRTLYGDEWIARLARDIGVPAPTLCAWKAGRLHLPLTHNAVKDTLRLLERRREEADCIAALIREVIKRERK